MIKISFPLIIAPPNNVALLQVRLLSVIYPPQQSIAPAPLATLYLNVLSVMLTVP